MLWRLLLIASLALSVDFDRIKGEESKEGSGNGFSDNFGGKDDNGEEEDFDRSGDGVLRESVPDNRHQPPSVETDDIDEEDGRNGGAGIVFEETRDVLTPEDANRMNAEPVSVDENNLLSHPAVIAAIAVGGFLVLVCLVVFFVLIVCCVRKKDEGTYNLDKAMKEKLQYITYTKAASDASEKEFFA